jgi:hypothetical protein
MSQLVPSITLIQTMKRKFLFHRFQLLFTVAIAITIFFSLSMLLLKNLHVQQNLKETIGEKERWVQNVFERIQVQNWGILSTKHVRSFAELIKMELISRGFSVSIYELESDNRLQMDFSDDVYIVMCPQIFPKLPVASRRIVYQMEQPSSGSRWFTKKYINILQNSRAVLDFSVFNMEFLRDTLEDYSRVSYLPAHSNSRSSDTTFNKTFDILFYGSYKSSPRRLRMINAIRNAFGPELRFEVVNEIYGKEMMGLIERTHLVVNIHYYEGNSTLEPRVVEALSLGIPVLSEYAPLDDYPDLDNCRYVRFFNEETLISSIKSFRGYLKTNEAKVKDGAVSCAQAGRNRFSFYFERFLLKERFITSKDLKSNIPFELQNKSMVLLTIPEMSRKSQFFSNHRNPFAPESWQLYAGYISVARWFGCALSYSRLSKHALRIGVHILVVAEDDSIFPISAMSTLNHVYSFLDTLQHWDIFNGLIADFPSTGRVIDVHFYKGLTFVTLDQMTSTVFSIFNRHMLEILADYEVNATLSIYNNTVDRYINSFKDLKIITTIPFLFEHDESMTSTLWVRKWDKRTNRELYHDLITESQRRILEKTKMFLLSNHNSIPEDYLPLFRNHNI